jgi:RNA polymerase sigma-70 factor, ECF subfamily
LRPSSSGVTATAVRLITRRNNQRLYRAASSVLKNRAEAEEAVQDGYLKASAAIDSFAGKSSLSTLADADRHQ